MCFKKKNSHIVFEKIVSRVKSYLAVKISHLVRKGESELNACRRLNNTFIFRGARIQNCQFCY